MLYEVNGYCFHCGKDIVEQRELSEREFENLKIQLEQTKQRDYSKDFCEKCKIKMIIVESVEPIY